MPDQLKWKCFVVSSALFSAGKFDELLQVFEKSWSKLGNSQGCAIFRDMSVRNQYYVSTMDAVLWEKLSGIVQLQDCPPPPYRDISWLAGDQPSAGK